MQRLRIIKYLPYLMILALSLACRGSIEPLAIPTISNHTISVDTTPDPVNNSTNTVLLPVVRQANDPTIASPTPDEPRELPEIRHEDDQYIVRGGDTLGNIASRNKITVQMLIDSNQIADPDMLEVGQILEIPAPILSETGSDFKIIPDSELVYGPFAQGFDIDEFVDRYDSYLRGYSEDVEGQTFTGPEVVLLVAHDYSVNPRLLVAILEYQSGWITQANPDEETWITPIGVVDGWHNGLYLQLAWTADMLNRGYYLWENDGIGGWLLSDGVTIPVNPTINAGTAGVQQFFALLYDRAGWDHAVSMDGLYATYSAFFGHPFDYAVEPLLLHNLEQPEMQLPFEPDVDWVYTGGPHGGWGSGSAWAALDFAPGHDSLGCVQSDLWVVSVADGPIIRADQGRVIQDLDGDGNEGTGWEVLYMHIEARGRVEPGTYLKAGEHIGHPSCEGGYSTGTHVHLARRYNGEWISADQGIAEDGLPFNLDGWVSSGNGIEYDGNLERDGEFKQAWEGYFPENTIHR